MRNIKFLFEKICNLVKVKARLRKQRNELLRYENIRDMFYVEESCGYMYVMCNGLAVTKFLADENVRCVMQVLKGTREIAVEYEKRKTEQKTIEKK